MLLDSLYQQSIFFLPKRLSLTHVQVVKTGLNVLFTAISKFIN